MRGLRKRLRRLLVENFFAVTQDPPVGTELKVMQELLRHSSFRSTLDVYTQAVTPAKHAAQAAVMSLVFSSDKDGGVLVAGKETGR